MIELNPIRNLFAIEVPENSLDFQLTTRYSPETGNDYTLLVWWNNIGHSAQKQLPYADYEILFTTSNATEQQAAGVVEKREHYKENVGHWATYPNYEKGDFSSSSTIAALQSLLRSNGLDASKNYLLIKRNEQ